MPFLRFKRIPSEGELESFDLFYKKLKALGIIDPKRYSIESLHFYRRISRFDLNHFDAGCGLFVGASSLFSFSGLAFRISRKILRFVAPKIVREEFKSYIIYDFTETRHRYLAGEWQAIKGFDEDLVKHNLDFGEVYWASLHLHWHALPQLHQGHLAAAQWLVGQLNEISDVYENDFSRLLKMLLNTGLLLECRRLPEAQEEVAAGIDFATKTQSGLGLIHFLGCRAHLDLLRADSAAAEEALEKADTIRGDLQPVPWQLSVFQRSRAELGLCLLQEALAGGPGKDIPVQKMRAYKFCRLFLRQSRKCAQYRTDAYRSMGLYYGLSKRPKRALGWRRKAIQEGERLGARIQLARTHFEVGRRLFEADARTTALDSLEAETYIEKAAGIFRELNLEGDLGQLETLTRRARTDQMPGREPQPDT